MAVPADSPTTPALLRSQLDAAIDARDRGAAVTVALEAVDSGSVSVADLYTQVLTPLLVDTGSAWQHGTERVWQEHFASHVVRTIVEALYPRVLREVANVPRIGKRVLLACPPTEQHELGLRMLSDRFELAGWEAVFLGADSPLEDIADAAHAIKADLVALSVSTVYERVELRSFIDELNDLLPDVRVVVGGPAFAHDRDAWTAEELLDPDELGLPGAPAEG